MEVESQIREDEENEELHKFATELNFERGEDLDDIEFEIDQQANQADDEKLADNILFYTQELGGLRQMQNKLMVYQRGPNCEHALRDLIRSCRLDDPEMPITKLLLGSWETFTKDLIPLLTLHYEDKRLSFYLIALLVSLTQTPSDASKKHLEMLSYLQVYKEAFTTKEVVDALVFHLHACLSKPEEERNKFENQMVELIFHLILNVLSIPTPNETQNSFRHHEKTIQLRLFKRFGQEGSIFHVLVYFTQKFTTDLEKKLALTSLGIFYQIFSSISPEFIMSSGIDDHYAKKMVERRRLERIKRLSEMSSRHPRFGANYQVFRPGGTSSVLIHNPNLKKIDFNTAEGQLRKPKVRKTRYNGTDINIYKDPVAQDTKDGVENSEDLEIKKTMKAFVLDFIQNSFSPLIEATTNDLIAESFKVNDDDYVNYMAVIEFSLQSYRLFTKRELEEQKRLIESRKTSSSSMAVEKLGDESSQLNEFDLSDVGAALQLTVLDLVYKQLVKEVSKSKVSEFKIKPFHAALAVFKEVMAITKELANCRSERPRKNAGILMQGIFSREFSKIFLKGFKYCEPVLHDRRYVTCIISSMTLFYDLLEDFAFGKVLKLQTDKRLRKKAKKTKNKKKRETKREKLDDNFVEEPLDDELQEEDGEYNPNNQQKGSGTTLIHDSETENNQAHIKEKEDNDEEILSEEEPNEEDSDSEDEPEIYKERKYTFQSEFAVVIDYAIIDKLLFLIKDDKLIHNSQELNDDIYKYLRRTVDSLKADWIFYQTNTLIVFEEILSNERIRTSSEYHDICQLIRKVVRSFFALLEKNPLLSVESLFRFKDRAIKDMVLNNYEAPEADLREMQALDPVLSDQKEFYMEVSGSMARWTEPQDRVLVENFEALKNLGNPYQELTELLHSLGFIDKNINDVNLFLGLRNGKEWNFREKQVKKRLKVLGIKKGKQHALDSIAYEYHTKKVKNPFSRLRRIKQTPTGIKLKQCGLDEALRKIKESTTKTQFKQMKKFIRFHLRSYIGGLQDEMAEEPLKNMSQLQDFAIVPLEPFEFDVLSLVDIENVLLALDFLRPSAGQIYFRIPGTLAAEQAKEKLREFNKLTKKETKMEEEKTPEKDRKTIEKAEKCGEKRKTEQMSDELIEEGVNGDEKGGDKGRVDGGKGTKGKEGGDCVEDAIDELERLNRPLLEESDEEN